MRKTFRTLLFHPCLVVFLIFGRTSAQDTPAASSVDTNRVNLAVQALTRLPEGYDLSGNPALQAAVTKLLQQTRGTANFVKIVRQFHLTGEDSGLLEVAAAEPNSEVGVEAMRMVIEQKNQDLIAKELAGTNVTAAVKIATALGSTHEKAAVPLLKSVILQPKLDLALRKQAVRSLVQTQAGARALLDLARHDQLPGELKFIATSELGSVRWPDVKTAAAEVLPPPAGQNAEPLPPLADLLKMRGDPAKGSQLFQSETVGCAKCHRVRGQGGEVGPDLSEIGTKLGKEGLLEAILDPNAGISFGYEVHLLELKSGDEAYGLLVSETPDEVAIKDTNGIVTHYNKSDIESRRQLKTSLMPTGLQQTMTPPELMDLVTFLSTLKKQPAEQPTASQ